MNTDLAYTGMPVRVLAHHAGISFGFYGTSHHATEDVPITWVIAGAHGRLAVAMGIGVLASLRAAEALASEGIEARVLDVMCLKPLDEEVRQAGSDIYRNARGDPKAGRRTNRSAGAGPALERPGLALAPRDGCERTSRVSERKQCISSS